MLWFKLIHVSKRDRWLLQCNFHIRYQNKLASSYRNYLYGGSSVKIRMYHPSLSNTLRPKTGRGEWSAGWIFTLTGVSTGWIFTPTGVTTRWNFTPTRVSNFHKNDPKRMARYENSAIFTQWEWLKMKKEYPTGICFTFENPTRGCNWGEKRGSKGWHILLTLTEGISLHCFLISLSMYLGLDPIFKVLFLTF